MSNSTNSQTPSSEQQWNLIKRLAESSLEEQKKARKWSIIFKSMTFCYLAFVLFAFWPSNKGVFENKSDEHVALIKIKGVIAEDQPANANAVAGGLRRAFEAEDSKAVVIAINSPGGSPVQSGYINDEITRLKKEYPEKPVYAVISDLGASGAYYIAVAADHIYANKASLIGSIGVISAGFGFDKAIDKLGIERRVYSSGDHKAFLDPFSPKNEEESAYWAGVLEQTHEQFKAVVREGRGERLKDTPEIFSGLVWNGDTALTLGLIDGLGSAGHVAREIIKVEDFVDYTVKKDKISAFLDRLSAKFQSMMVSSQYIDML